MTEELITRWNNKVKEEDTVYIVGDFNFKGVRSTNRLFKRLKGYKIFIHGNHDQQETLIACYIHILGKDWEVVHNPEDSSHQNVLHGHVHLPIAQRVRHKNGRLFVNVNTELWDYTPVSIKQIRKEIKKSEIK